MQPGASGGTGGNWAGLQRRVEPSQGKAVARLLFVHPVCTIVWPGAGHSTRGASQDQTHSPCPQQGSEGGLQGNGEVDQTVTGEQGLRLPHLLPCLEKPLEDSEPARDTVGLYAI